MIVSLSQWTMGRVLLVERGHGVLYWMDTLTFQNDISDVRCKTQEAQRWFKASAKTSDTSERFKDSKAYTMLLP